jgi:hypothetical protein
VGDFELRLVDKTNMALFRKRIVCATQDNNFLKNITTTPFSSVVSISDEAFALFVLKNNEVYLDALVSDAAVELSKQNYPPRWSKIKGCNVKDRGKKSVPVPIGLSCTCVLCP